MPVYTCTTTTSTLTADIKRVSRPRDVAELCLAFEARRHLM
jgi:hypothetical protein